MDPCPARVLRGDRPPRRGRAPQPQPAWGSAEYAQVTALNPPHLSTRAVIVVDADRISDSCGFGVPVMDLVGERDQLHRWTVAKGPEGVAEYLAAKNTVSVDGLPGLGD